MSTLPSLVRRSPELPIGALVSAFESETAGVLLRTAPRNERQILYVITSMVVLTIALMSVTRLDKVVTSTGDIVPIEGNLFVQPYDKAIVREIRVKAGDVVHKGEVLATLDPTFATADLTQLQQKVSSGSALVARIEAERAGKPYTGGEQPSEMLQASIYRQRAAEFHSGVADFDARIRGDQAQIARARQDVESYQKRLKIATDIETMNQTLEQHGFGSKLKTNIATDSRIDVDRQLAESTHQAQQYQHDLDALTAQRSVYMEHWNDDLGSQLVTARNELALATQDLTKATKMHQLVDLTAPRDAVVLRIGNASAGSVTGPVTGDGPTAQPLFTLVPIDGPLEADIQISADEIGFVQVGDPVQIKLDAYPFIRHGLAKGTIKTISEGSFTINQNQQPVAPFFKARVAILDAKLQNVPDTFRLIPGMTLSGDVKVGSRTLISYLIDGALRTGSEAMREP